MAVAVAAGGRNLRWSVHSEPLSISTSLMLNRQQYLVREKVGLLKLSDGYDILDPDSKTKIGEAREEISRWVKYLRPLIGKNIMPTQIAVYAEAEPAEQQQLFSMRRGSFMFFRAKVEIRDAQGQSLGWLKSKFGFFRNVFQVCSADGQEIAAVKGDWSGWNLRFLSGDTELGIITKKWTGLGRELFTSADNYLIRINGAPDPSINLLLLAAGLAVDTVLHENK